MIDSHFHLWTTDHGSPEKRAERADQIAKEAAALGVDRVCLIGPYALSSDYPNEYGRETAPPAETNRIVERYVEEHPDLCFGWAQIDPRDGEEAVAEFRRAVTDGGLIGLKHHFLGSPVKLSDPLFDPIAEAAVEMDVPILEHVLHRLSPYPEEYPAESYTEDVTALADRFPDLKIISAHIAGGGDWEYRIKHVRDYPNVYLDISGSVRDAGIIEMAAEWLGVDRLVFGTDTWFTPGVGKLKGCDLSAAEKAKIAYRMGDLLPDSVPNRYSEDELATLRTEREAWFAEASTPVAEPLTTVNAFIGEYAHRDHDASADRLIAVMDQHGVDRAVVSATEATLYRNVQSANERLHRAVDGHRDRLIPVATINPTYAAWETDLDTCLDEFAMKGVKLLPAYHDYDLDDPAMEAVLTACADQDVPVIISAVLEDQRQRHPRVKLRDFHGMHRSKWWSGDQISQLESVLRSCPEPDVIIADTWNHAYGLARSLTQSNSHGVRLDNFQRSGATLFVLGDLNMYFTEMGERIVEEIGPDHLVFGPKLPYKNFQSYYEYLEQLPASEAAKAGVRNDTVMDLFAH